MIEVNQSRRNASKSKPEKKCFLAQSNIKIAVNHFSSHDSIKDLTTFKGME
jgi:hypothetical protein